MKQTIYIILVLLACGLSGQLQAQIDTTQQISLTVKSQPLQEVLETISEQYLLNFAYSKNYVDVQQKVSVEVKNVRLPIALDKLFETTTIVYKFIGNQIVLKSDNKKKKNLDLGMNTPDYSTPTLVGNPIIPVKQEAVYPLARPPHKRINVSPSHRYESLADYINWEHLSNMPPIDYGDIDMTTIAPVRMTVIPGVEAKWTVYKCEMDLDNQVSINVLWGVNDTLNGIEFGGIANTIRYDMEGVQIAGLYNNVGGTARGLQLSFLANSAQTMNGLQFSSMSNWAGRANTQIATGLNVADTIMSTQLALVNVGGRVEGRQIGLINFADTSNISIGLFNFIKKGYHTIELASEEAFYTNLTYKFGTPRFYSLLHFGYHPPTTAWNVGYGWGTKITFNNRVSTDLELLANHVSDTGEWIPTLNLMGQFKWTLELPLGQHLGLFIGPTYNVIFSKTTDESGLIGSSIVPKDRRFYNKNIENNTVNTQMWWNATAGIRINI